MASTFNENELMVTSTRPGSRPGFPPQRVYGNRPITSKENMQRMYQGKPMWLPSSKDVVNFCPSVVPDNVARGFVWSGEHFDAVKEGGGPDMFGIEWIYVPQVGGSMVKPGNPLMDDVNDWKKLVKFPDVNSWDWSGSRKANEEFIQRSKDSWICFTLLSGAWFERLISFMDFEGAAMALIDDEQQGAVHELFTATTDLLIQIVDKALEIFPEISSFCVHDDWGSQAAPFFSQDTAMEMIVPHMRKLVDHIHAKGRIAEMHSCGHSEDRIEAYIAAGWDSWCPQSMNDQLALFRGYGDRIVIEKIYTNIDSLDKAQQKALAREVVDTYAKPDRTTRLFMFAANAQVFEEEVYRLSRLAYGE